jgi:hypothetical protein
MTKAAIPLVLFLALGGIIGDGTAEVVSAPMSGPIILPPPSPPTVPPCVRACVAAFQRCSAHCGSRGECLMCTDELQACLEDCGVLLIPTALGLDESLSSPPAETSHDIERRTR